MERYRLIEQLGTGGMSVVWRAYDEVLGRPVAVKQLMTADPGSRDRIQAEARLAALLSHPNIAAVYDFGHTRDGAPFVVMELVEGESLEERLHRAGGPLETTAALRIAAQLASALTAVHARGLVHHDVKPANVMLTTVGAKLVDFGVSAIAGDDTDQLLGTPAYLAPERLRGIPPSAATDVYALGLVLYRMLAGSLPWPAATTTEELLHAHRKLAPAPLPATLELPDGVADALRRCLAKAPGNRPTAADLATRFAALPATRPFAVRLGSKLGSRLGSRLGTTLGTPLSATRRATRSALSGSTPGSGLGSRLGSRLAVPAHRLREAGPAKRKGAVAVAAILFVGLGAAGAAAQDRDPVAAWTPSSQPATATLPADPSAPADPTSGAADPTSGADPNTKVVTGPVTGPGAGPAAGPGAGPAPGPGAGPAEGGPKKGKGKGKSKKSGG